MRREQDGAPVSLGFAMETVGLILAMAFCAIAFLGYMLGIF